MKTIHEIDERGLKLTVVINTPTIFPIEDPLMPSIFPVAEPLREGVETVAAIFGKPPEYVNTIAALQPEIVAALAQFKHVNASDLIAFFDVVFTSVESQLFEGSPEATLPSRLGVDQCLSAGQIDTIIDRIACQYIVDLSFIDAQPDLTIGEIISLAGEVIFPVWEVPTIQEPGDTVNPTSVQARVVTVIADQMGFWQTPAGGIQLTDRFVQDLSCDSLDVVEIVMAIEDEFDIEIDDAESEGCVTVADAIGLVTSTLTRRHK